MNFVFVLILLYANVRGQLEGGDRARPNQFPYVVQIYEDEEPDMQIVNHEFQYPDRICTGVIIRANFVLTAAHCITDHHKAIDHPDKITEDVWIIAGDVHLDSENFKYLQRKVDDIAYPPKYDVKTQSYDIALLYFNKPLPTRLRSVKAIQIGTGVPIFGTRCRVAHWGKTSSTDEEEDSGSESHYLKHASGTIVPGWMKCGMFDNIDRFTFCVEFENAGTRVLFGDSGGPLLCKVPVTDRNGRVTEKEMLFGTLVGKGFLDHDKVDKKKVTVSRGSYTKVSAHLEWINNKIEEIKENYFTLLEQRVRERRQRWRRRNRNRQGL